MKFYVLLAALAASSSAFAADPMSPAGPPPAKCPLYDVNPIIASIDKDRDDQMTPAEWDAAGAPPTAFGMIANGAPNVTRKAFEAMMTPPDLDMDGDCRITLDELKARDKRVGGPMGTGGWDKVPGPPPPAAGPSKPNG